MTTGASTDRSEGAYGFRLVVDGGERRLKDLVALNGGSPTVNVHVRHASVLEDTLEIDAGRVRMSRRGGVKLEITREPHSITVDLGEMIDQEALIHPVLALPISVLARWRGDVTLHAGAFATEAGAWGILGTREAGKSTMLASLAERGRPIVGDDLLAVHDGVVQAGPSCVDLRPDVAARMESARCLGKVGERIRHRVSTPPGPSRVPLRGFFLLGWQEEGSEVTVSRLSAPEQLKLLYAQEYMGLLGPADPHKLFDLTELPAWRVLRPRDWAATQATIDAMLGVTAETTGVMP